MTTFWNSPDQLATTLRWLTIVTILSAAVFGAAIYFVNDRIGTLQATQILNQGTSITDQSQTIALQNQQITHLNEDLKSVREKAAELTTRTQNTERGISDVYEFNGNRRQGLGPGHTAVSVGPETNVFRKIMELQGNKDWIELLTVCEAQIKSTPNWLTPYLFSGIANANLGNFVDAEERLEFVVTKAGNDPNYSVAPGILARIKAARQ
jgi:hypothetical protein